jgi:hypothetical protein
VWACRRKAEFEGWHQIIRQGVRHQATKQFSEEIFRDSKCVSTGIYLFTGQGLSGAARVVGV